MSAACVLRFSVRGEQSPGLGDDPITLLPAAKHLAHAILHGPYFSVDPTFPMLPGHANIPGCRLGLRGAAVYRDEICKELGWVAQRRALVAKGGKVGQHLR